jgi:hypothetical protein
MAWNFSIFSFHALAPPSPYTHDVCIIPRYMHVFLHKRTLKAMVRYESGLECAIWHNINIHTEHTYMMGPSYQGIIFKYSNPIASSNMRNNNQHQYVSFNLNVLLLVNVSSLEDEPSGEKIKSLLLRTR